MQPAPTAFATIQIGKSVYGLAIVQGRPLIARLDKPDGTTYEVRETATGPVCSCPDATHRKNGADLYGCKHVQATRDIGLLPPVQPVAPATVTADLEPAEVCESKPTVSVTQENQAEPESKAAPIPKWSLMDCSPPPRLPLSDPEPAPVALTEKHRPKYLADVVGQGAIVWQLQQFAEAPYSDVILLEGDTGTGKTSVALALATELGIVIEEGEFGGLYKIQSGDQTKDSIQEAFRKFWHRPPFGSGWRMVLVNEAHCVSPQAATYWLDQLENLPPRCVVVFTTDQPKKLPTPLRNRCQHFTFSSDPETLAQDAQALLDSIWQAELGRNHSPRVADLPGVVEDGAISFRRVVRAIQPLIQIEREKDRCQSPQATVATIAESNSPPSISTTAPEAAQIANEPPSDPNYTTLATPEPSNPPLTATPETIEPRRRRTYQRHDSAPWEAIERDYRNGDGKATLARRYGIPESSIYNGLKKRGAYDHQPPSKPQAPASVQPVSVEPETACDDEFAGLVWM